jgi:hypothetical protein
MFHPTGTSDINIGHSDKVQSHLVRQYLYVCSGSKIAGIVFIQRVTQMKKSWISNISPLTFLLQLISTVQILSLSVLDVMQCLPLFIRVRLWTVTVLQERHGCRWAVKLWTQSPHCGIGGLGGRGSWPIASWAIFPLSSGVVWTGAGHQTGMTNITSEHPVERSQLIRADKYRKGHYQGYIIITKQHYTSRF